MLSYVAEGSAVQLALSTSLALTYALLAGSARAVTGFTWCVLTSAIAPTLWVPASLVAACLLYTSDAADE